jgi:hypothetical protein
MTSYAIQVSASCSTAVGVSEDVGDTAVAGRTAGKEREKAVITRHKRVVMALCLAVGARVCFLPVCHRVSSAIIFTCIVVADSVTSMLPEDDEEQGEQKDGANGGDTPPIGATDLDSSYSTSSTETLSKLFCLSAASLPRSW